MVDAGNDPITGKRRQVHRTFKAPNTKRGAAEADTALAKLIAEVEAGRAIPSSGLTAAQLIERHIVDSDLRPGDFGSGFGAPFENGAAWRFPARRAAPRRASSSAFRAVSSATVASSRATSASSSAIRSPAPTTQRLQHSARSVVDPRVPREPHVKPLNRYP